MSMTLRFVSGAAFMSFILATNLSGEARGGLFLMAVASAVAATMLSVLAP